MKKLIILLLCLGIPAILFAGNTATVTTTGNTNTATITQTGDSNQGVIDQTANTSTATQNQTGTNNDAYIQQLGKWPAGPVVNETALQTQDGSGHQAEIKQVTDSGHGNSTATQTQSGANHYAKAGQFSWNSTIDQTQNGSDQNWAEAYQKGNENHIVQIQDGRGNVAAVDEQDGWGSPSTGSEARQEQTGRWNHSLIGQYGGDLNIAKVYQTGDDNWAGYGLSGGGQWGIYQSGSTNSAIVTQNLNVNKSEVFQYGNGNDATVTQNGGTGLFGDYGDYVNKSVVTQTGDNNTSTVTQTYP